MYNSEQTEIYLGNYKFIQPSSLDDKFINMAST